MGPGRCEAPRLFNSASNRLEKKLSRVGALSVNLVNHPRCNKLFFYLIQKRANLLRD